METLVPKTFTDYMAAVSAAQRLANETGQRVAIHIATPGRYTISLWFQGDRAEVIHPQQGFILVVALLVISLLSLLGVTFLGLALTEHTIARNHYHRVKAFNIAEAGLEHGSYVLSSTNIISVLAQGGQLSFGPSVPFDGGVYEVKLTNNCTPVNGYAADIAGCAGANGNGDNLAFIISTGKYANESVTLGALVERAQGGGNATTIRGWWEVSR